MEYGNDIVKSKKNEHQMMMRRRLMGNSIHRFQKNPFMLLIGTCGQVRISW